MALLTHTGRGVEIGPAELVSVLGAPGSGKTRLGLELAYLARPESGQVLFDGQDPTAVRRRLELPRRPREITMLVQNAEDQLFAKTVYDDVAFGPRHLGLKDEEIEDRVMRALEAVRMRSWDVRERSPFALSGGERRRVALAGVLAMEPEVLILDEPTANLDPGTRADFLDLLAPLRGRSAIVWLTSSAREASLADRVYLLRAGQAQEVPTGDMLLRSWRDLSESGVEVPAIYEVAAAVEDRGYRIPEVASRDELVAALVAAWRERPGDR